MSKKPEIPEFDITKYECANTLSLSEWYQQIGLRRSANYLIGVYKGTRSERSGEIGEHPLFRRPTEKLCRESLARLIGQGVVGDLSPYESHVRFSFDPTYTMTVRPLSCDSVCAMASHLGHIEEIHSNLDSLEKAKEEVWQGLSGDQLTEAQLVELGRNVREASDRSEDAKAKAAPVLANPYDRFMSETGKKSPTGFFHIAVHLLATNEQIVSDFQRWLRETRQAYGVPAPKKNFSKSVLHRWVEHRLLPYLDLHLLHTFLGDEFPAVKAADMIFPDMRGTVGEDKIRKTVKPQALELISDEMMLALQAETGMAPPR